MLKMTDRVNYWTHYMVLTRGAAIPPNLPAIEQRPSPVVLTTVGYISTV